MTKDVKNKMPTSSKEKEVSVYVPERKQNRVIKRFSKRKTTLRQFTFVKDWQSPAVEVRQHHDLSQPQKPEKKIGSVVSSSPVHENIPTVLSPASLSRVSPSPCVIANSSPKVLLSPASLSRVSPSPCVITHLSPKTQALSSNSQQRETPANRLPSDFRILHSPPSTQRYLRSKLSISANTSTSSKPIISADSLSSNSSTKSQPATRSQSRINVHSSKQIDNRSHSKIQESSNSNNNQTTTRQIGDQSESVDVVGKDQSVTTDDQLEAEDDRSDLVSDQGDRLDVQSELAADASDDRLEREDNSQGTVTRALRPSSVQSLLKTPANKSVSITYRTPVSGPTSRVAAKKRNVSPIQKKGGKQPKRVQSKKIQSKPGSEVSPGSKAKVRLWIGSGRRRTAVDTTDLDIILSKIDTISSEYRQNLSNKQQRKAIVRFNQYVKKDLTDKIDLAQEHKELKSSLSRMTITTRKQRKELLTLQQKNIRLDMQIAEIRKQTLNKQENDKALGNISTFLTDLQNLQKEYVDTRPQDHKKEEFRVTSDNLGVVLREMKSVSHSRYKLRTINNQLQDWIDSH